MPNRHQLKSHCTRCDRPRQPGERFSARGRCDACGRGHLIANRDQLKAHRGPYFDRWADACLRAFGGIARLDALERDEQTGPGDNRTSQLTR